MVKEQYLLCNQIGKHKTDVNCFVHKEYMCIPNNKQKKRVAGCLEGGEEKNIGKKNANGDYYSWKCSDRGGGNGIMEMKIKEQENNNLNKESKTN